jgi:hypothetical protein
MVKPSPVLLEAVRNRNKANAKKSKVVIQIIISYEIGKFNKITLLDYYF